jgi:hypothetical protein
MFFKEDTMNRILISCALLAIFFIRACMTMPAKWDGARLKGAADRCKEEYRLKEPSTSGWYDLKTQERNKKKKEYEEYKKQQLELYRAVYNFKKIYLAAVDEGGRCRKDACKVLEKLRKQITDACPAAGESFPAVVPRQ